MAVLSDGDIKKALREKHIVIKGLSKDNIGPASVDLTLGNVFRVFRHSEVTHIDTNKGITEEMTELIKVPKGKPFVIHPNEFALAVTKEYVKLPSDIMARLDGRSSLGRLGIIVHSTAGSIDPGFEGTITLEMTNIARVPVQLWPGMKICRLTFETLTSSCEVPYNKRKSSKYNKSIGPAVSRIHLDKL
ncbi:MAG: dCTP deaminase [Candidatus Diapherotrites archaeon]